MKFHIFVAFAVLAMWMPAHGVESFGEGYWKMNLGNDVAMPKVVKEALGTTSFKGYEVDNAKDYAQVLSEGLSSELLSSNRNYGWQKASTIDTKDYKHNVVQYFLPKDIVHPTTTKMKLVFLMGAKEAKFIPSKISNSIPFSSSKLQNILQFFAVTPKSENAKIIKEAITSCELAHMKGEKKYCVTSLESMIDYAKSQLGSQQVKALSTEVDKETEQEYEIESATKLKNDKNLACHKMVYPYAVFYCHTLSKTDAYEVSLVDVNGKKLRAVAICHKDTSNWNPGHIAFQILKVKPGSVPICHFLNVDAMLWVPK